MKTYRGQRNHLVQVGDGGDWTDLDPRYDLANHSPTGFSWGYGGSGPAQLALALLADAMGRDELALAWYQDFKWAVIARILSESWTLTERQVNDWLVMQLAEELKHRRDGTTPEAIPTGPEAPG